MEVDAAPQGFVARSPKNNWSGGNSRVSRGDVGIAPNLAGNNRNSSRRFRIAKSRWTAITNDLFAHGRSRRRMLPPGGFGFHICDVRMIWDVMMPKRVGRGFS